MAGGIDWFRWHHGSVADQKFGLVAHKAGASVAEVIAVWACLLESASASDERGLIGVADFEAMDFALGMAEGRSASIYAAMQARKLIDAHGHIVKWHQRQPKRERDDDKSTDRVRAFRQKQRQETPGNATERQETPRGEESREEKILRVEGSTESIPRAGALADSPTRAGLACKRMKSAGIASVSPSHPRLLALLDAGISDDELAEAAAEAASKGKGFPYALAVAEGRRRDASIAPLPRASPAARETAYQRSVRERMSQLAPGVAAKPPDAAPPPINADTIDVQARRIAS